MASTSNVGSSRQGGDALANASVTNAQRLSSSKSQNEPVVEEDIFNDEMNTVTTVGALLVLCLKLGIDPPDQCKPKDCSRILSWVRPSFDNVVLSASSIASNLAINYRNVWDSQMILSNNVYTKSDPTFEKVERTCLSLRHRAQGKRLLFHYNGYGVLLPTPYGEIWFFNKQQTKYIPISIKEVAKCMGSPTIYVFDCSQAGGLIEKFNTYDGSIILAACCKDEMLPLDPDLPADFFTSCLTTPIRTAIYWFVKMNRNKLVRCSEISMLEEMPDDLKDRRSILGELNWIFICITDAIAWTTLPKHLFKYLFREDISVANLFRNFLLAQRLMRLYDCMPISQPFIPSLHNHFLWSHWDLVLDHFAIQVYNIRENSQQYIPSDFFVDHIESFRIWLRSYPTPNTKPIELPMLIHLILVKSFRLEVLKLLDQFLDFGPWAARFTFELQLQNVICKLIPFEHNEMKYIVFSILSKMLAAGHETLPLKAIEKSSHILNVLREKQASFLDLKIMSVFIVTAAVKGNFQRQRELAFKQIQVNPSGTYIDIALSLLLNDSNINPTLKLWLVVSFGILWENNEDVRLLATRNAVIEKFHRFLDDPLPEIRAATVYAYQAFINSAIERNEHIECIDIDLVANIAMRLPSENSTMVRKEILVTFYHFIDLFESSFLQMFRNQGDDEKVTTLWSYSFPNIFKPIWSFIKSLLTDCDQDISSKARKVYDHFTTKILEKSKANYTSPLKKDKDSKKNASVGTLSGKIKRTLFGKGPEPENQCVKSESEPVRLQSNRLFQKELRPKPLIESNFGDQCIESFVRKWYS